MKTYKFLFLILVGALLASCFKDDTNTEYHAIDRPILVSPYWPDATENPGAISDPREYTIALGDTLKIPTVIEYKDMGDLSYRWVIDSVLVSTDKDLKWVCNIEKPRAKGIFYIRRNSAGNEEVFEFSVILAAPYSRGYCILARDRQGSLQYHVLSETAPAFTYTLYTNVTGGPISSVSPIKTTEYFSCEAGGRDRGKMMYIDADPAMCYSMNSQTLVQEMPLAQECIDDKIPDKLLQVKDIAFQGSCAYILGADGKLYGRKNATGYYTGLYIPFPVRYNNKELKVDALIKVPYSQKYFLVYEYDETASAGRFLCINTAYQAAPAGGSLTDEQLALVGTISEMPASSDMHNLPNKKYVYSTVIQDMMRKQKWWMLFKDNSDGNCYARQFTISYRSETSQVNSVSYDYKDSPMDDVDENSVIAAIDGDASMMGIDLNYVYYTHKSDRKKLMVRHRDAGGMGPAKELRTFASEIVAISSGKSDRNGAILCIGFADGTVMIYRMQKFNSFTNFTNFTADQIVKPLFPSEPNGDPGADASSYDFGEIINITWKGGLKSNTYN